MRIEKTGLMGLLEAVDKELKRPVHVVAVGGTAMTLLGMKPSTIDIDFCLSQEDLKEFRKALKAVPHGFRIDLFADGMIFSQKLPEDYLERSIAIKTGLKKIRLSAMNPVDIIVTKAGRMDERDLEDIASCIEKFRITKEQIEERAKLVEYVGREENYRDNIREVIKRFFSNR
ncbi:MAG: DUF6036 family nucleotidyltransferase [Candidatus Aenigmarchaeota archaeon]|nr:DUF6036 family nucleotidyltransferase [Candidatus Aenigmarchaeota archaeon]